MVLTVSEVVEGGDVIVELALHAAQLGAEVSRVEEQEQGTGHRQQGHQLARPVKKNKIQLLT